MGEVLGIGSFGRVNFGLNLDTGELMAIKQVHIGNSREGTQEEVCLSFC
jgi:serine/threonine protein kinase